MNPTEPAQTQIGSTQPATEKESYINLKGALQAVWVQFRETFPDAADASPEAIPGSGIPAGESALPDAGSEDVGNAAPSVDRVVHHGDLAP